MRALGVLVITILLSGCAGGMSKEACLYADWHGIGYEDGAAGRQVSAVSSRRAACAEKAGVTIDMAAYRAGREEGLKVFCEPSNGYAFGAYGGNYTGVCAGPREPEFMSAYQTGRHLFNLEQEVALVSGLIGEANGDLDRIDRQITHTEVALVAPGVSPEERLHMLADLKGLFEEKESIKRSLPGLHRDLRQAEAELEDYRAHIAFNGPYPREVLEAERTSY